METIEGAPDSFRAGYLAALANVAAELRHRIARDEERIREHEHAAAMLRLSPWAPSRGIELKRANNAARDLRSKVAADVRALGLVTLEQARARGEGVEIKLSPLVDRLAAYAPGTAPPWAKR